MLERKDKIERRKNDRHDGKHDHQADCQTHADVAPQVPGCDIAAAEARAFSENQEPVPRNGDADASECQKDVVKARERREVRGVGHVIKCWWRARALTTSY